MKLRDISTFLDNAVPLSYQKHYDNSGLQVGDPESEISSALIAVDAAEEVVDEAVAHGCSLIITHHPLIFQPLKKITGRTQGERIVTKAIKNGIAVYSAHTNLDVMYGGVSMKMAEKLAVENAKPLVPLQDRLIKLVTFVPESHIEKVRNAVFSAGAGVIGNYDSCSFNSSGYGTFRGNENTSPFAGRKGSLHQENEIRFETILFSHNKNSVVEALIGAHPYEEPAFDLYNLANNYIMAGMGCIGDIAAEIPEMDLLLRVSEVFGSEGIRYSPLTGRSVKKVALCGGAGAGMISEAIAQRADAFITGDLRYHDFFKADGRILLADIGHYESEKCSTEIIYDLIIKKFPTFALRFSESITNPINYL